MCTYKMEYNLAFFMMHVQELLASLIFLLFQYKRPHILDTESFEWTFGPKAQRKRPKLACTDLEVRKMLIQLIV